MSCCGSLFVNLGGGGGTVNTGVLQIAGGVALDSTLRFVEDQNGTDSVLKLSTDKIQFDFATYGGLIFDSKQYAEGAIWSDKITPDIYNFGFACDGNFTYVNAQSSIGLTLGGAGGKFELNSNGINIGGGTQNGALTVKGAGANIVSFRNSSNAETIYFGENGTGYFTNGIVSSNTIRTPDLQTSNIYANNAVYNMVLHNFTQISFGTTTDFPAIVATNTTPSLAAKDATNTNLIPFSAEDFKSANLSAGTLNTARPMQFGDKGTVTTGNDLGLDAQIAVEHNGNVYYIPCSTVLLT
jgi:hypothetical protein